MPSLNVSQAQFLTLPHKFRAFVAGFGSGKTWVGCSALSKHFMEWPGVNAGYFAPTYPQIRDIFYPTMDEVAYDWGLKTKINQANHEVHIYSGRQYRGTVICRSMEKPQTIVGFKIGHALVDELDVLTAVKAQQAWRKIIARMRYNLPGLKNGVDVTTTPEGFKFVFLQFVKQLRDKPSLKEMYGLVQASTFDNELNLPEDYIASLMESYPPQLIMAYLKGQFVNLTSGTIYTAYDRKLNGCFDTVQPGEPLFIGMDFNVGKMAAINPNDKRVDPKYVAEQIRDVNDKYKDPMSAIVYLPMTTIKLSGSLAQKFGRLHRRQVGPGDTWEVFRALKATIEGFEAEISRLDRLGLRFAIFRNRKNVGAAEFGMGGTKEIRIVPVVEGAKRAGLLQTIIGVVLIAASYVTGGSTLATGIALVAGGVVQMLSPQAAGLKQSASPENQPSYALGSAKNTTASGNPVPICIGERRWGGAIISASIYAEDKT